MFYICICTKLSTWFKSFSTTWDWTKKGEISVDEDMSNETFSLVCCTVLSCETEQKAQLLFTHPGRVEHTYILQRIVSALVQVMYYRLLGAKPLSDPMRSYYLPRCWKTNFREIWIKIQCFQWENEFQTVTLSSFNVLIKIMISHVSVRYSRYRLSGPWGDMPHGADM